MAFESSIKAQLIESLGENWVRDDEVTLYTYRCDGLTLSPSLPMGVVFPGNKEELIATVKLFSAHDISFLPRGAGTGLSGGAVPQQNSVIIEMFRFQKIHEIDELNRTITLEPGIVNLRISEKAKNYGLYFAPDPSSQKACTVGGNVGENAGGPHTLKYGVTVDHIVGLEVVLYDGEIIKLGGKCMNNPGPDLLGMFIGSEGTFGIVTKITCRLTPVPETAVTLLGVFPDVVSAGKTVSGIIRAGIIPAAMEMLDQIVIQAVEQAFHVGFPTDAQALLIIELEDLKDGIHEDRDRIIDLVNQNNATEVRVAKNEAERNAIWKARKEAFGALGTITPNFYTQDGVIPRSALPEVLSRMYKIGEKHNLRVANVFHAGDGNLHPLVLYDSQIQGESERAEMVAQQIIELCLEVGGSLSGEHGIGLEKNHLMPQLFSADDLDNFRLVKEAFNPKDLLNPGKIFPSPSKCLEVKSSVKHKTGIAV